MLYLTPNEEMHQQKLFVVEWTRGEKPPIQHWTPKEISARKLLRHR